MPSTITAAVRRLPNPATDATLLTRFAADRDDPAFAELVRRHGPLVLGVCRRLAGADAEDAFQAVFLVLARKAGSVSRPERLANYLYGVAVRVGRRARRSAGRRRERTMPRLPDVPAPVPPDPELAERIDAALCRLPDRLRAAVILCEIQGLSRTEAATRLGIPEGTLSSRLADARKRLAEMLRGQVILAGLTMPVSVALADRAVAAATGELVSGAVLALATGGTTMRTVTLALTTLTLAGLTAMAGAIPTDKPADPPAKPAAKGDGPPKEVPTYTAKPKLGKFVDIPATTERIEWTGDGKQVVVMKRVVIVADGPANVAPRDRRRTIQDSVILVDVARGVVAAEVTFGPMERFLAISPDGERMLVVRRDAAKISGVHRLEVWQRQAGPKPPPGTGSGPQESPIEYVSTRRMFDLDSEETVSGRFDTTGATVFLTRSRLMEGLLTDVRLCKWNLGTTDSAGEEELKLDGKYRHVGQSPNLSELLTVDLESNWEWHSADPKRPTMKVGVATESQKRYPKSPFSFASAISPGGTRAVVSASIEGAVIHSAILSRTERGLKIDTFGSSEAHQLGTFSADGKLFSAVAFPPLGKRLGNDPGTLTVWQMTGDGNPPSVVKWWNGPAVTAFAPNKPVLATAEPLDRTTTRLGFWDFGPPPGK